MYVLIWPLITLIAGFVLWHTRGRKAHARRHALEAQQRHRVLAAAVETT